MNSEMSSEELAARVKSNNIREINIRLITDKSTAIKVTMLLAYLRNSLINDIPSDIKLSIGKKIQGIDFKFTVNDQEVPDYKAQPILEIN